MRSRRPRSPPETRLSSRSGPFCQKQQAPAPPKLEIRRNVVISQHETPLTKLRIRRVGHFHAVANPGKSIISPPKLFPAGNTRSSKKYLTNPNHYGKRNNGNITVHKNGYSLNIHGLLCHDDMIMLQYSIVDDTQYGITN